MAAYLAFGRGGPSALVAWRKERGPPASGAGSRKITTGGAWPALSVCFFFTCGSNWFGAPGTKAADEGAGRGGPIPLRSTASGVQSLDSPSSEAGGGGSDRGGTRCQSGGPRLRHHGGSGTKTAGLMPLLEVDVEAGGHRGARLLAQMIRGGRGRIFDSAHRPRRGSRRDSRPLPGSPRPRERCRP